jgi:hypothetical protein
MKESKVTSIGLLLAFACTAQAQSRCDAACLSVTMNDYLAKTTGHRASEIRVSRDALIYFNTHAGRLDENPLGRARTIISAQIFADPESGNVMARTGLELEDRKIAYASTRLKVSNGNITQVESSFDDSPSVVASYLTPLNPLMTEVVPADKRMSRAEMKAMVARYYQSLTTDTALESDFDGNCDRYHSGLRITNNPRITVEGGAVVTCYTAMLGNPPWGPATDIHIPLIDTEHGIVAGYTLLLYHDGSPPMYVSEVFKIVGGKIRMIDNIGLKAADMKAVNFPE